MKFGFAIPNRGPLATRVGVIDLARRGEAHGFDFIGVSDHIVIPRSIASRYPYSDTGDFPGGDIVGQCLEQLTTLSFLAAATESARLLTTVMVVPYRAAVHAAKILATIDVLSEGRLDLGIGAGWMREEFEAVGAPDYDRRGRVTDEYIAAFKELWTATNPEFSADYVSFSDIAFEPKPVQSPHPPIWTGGESPPALRRAGRLADTWYPIGNNPNHRLGTPARLAEYYGRVKKHAEEAGREPEAISLAYAASWYDERNAQQAEDGSRLILTGRPEQIAGDIQSLAEVGVESILIDVLGFDLQTTSTTESAERMDFFTREIRPLVG